VDRQASRLLSTKANPYNIVAFRSPSLAIPRQNHTLEKGNTQRKMECARSTGLPTSNLAPKLLHRFYESLGFLFALGKARGEHTHKTLPSLEQVDSLTAQQLKRQFLDELAFLCDYKKGGDSCTAIVLGQTPQHYVFWVAANKCPERLIIPFLVELLKILEGACDRRDGQLLIEDISRISITFAGERIKTYAKYLLSDLEKLKGFPICTHEPVCKSCAFGVCRTDLLICAI
jgi:hypothetical protein